jgi:serine/threonine protein kinase
MINLARYTVTKKLQETADSILYRGYNNADRVPVAVKLPKRDYPTPRELAKLRHEYLILRDLDIPGVVKAFELEASDHGLALVLEHLAGRPLSEVIHTQRLDLKTALWVGAALAEILSALHRNRVIHKDIKPHNIIFDEDAKKVVLIDFGISTRLSQESPKLGNPDTLEGTLAYMSPEQTGRMNRVLDQRSDLYSLDVSSQNIVEKLSI